MQNVFPYMVIHSAFCRFLWFYHGFCMPQNSFLPAVMAALFIREDQFLSYLSVGMHNILGVLAKLFQVIYCASLG